MFLAGVAQLVEQLICNQQVGGSNPSASSIFFNRLGLKVFVSPARYVPEMCGTVLALVH